MQVIAYGMKVKCIACGAVRWDSSDVWETRAGRCESCAANDFWSFTDIPDSGPSRLSLGEWRALQA